MEHFQPFKTNNKVCLVYLQSKLQQDKYSWCIYVLKYLKSKGKTHLDAKKQQKRYRLTYLVLSKLEQSYGWCFEDQRTTPKVNETFSAVKNKQ